ncbi:rod shape-determining protein RodA [Roseivirga misakiensis]|uniref:Cell wall polymerase n=1 Tax=Roseivirga misakiensis TaxID=1563681 RepID=A0A1E5T633_9BACT|nr:rod shape-determining protein RodA [Roseivirga misakiensis]OEK06808.1 rod shape-determining protein RodA [Roseivirga misakiensis]
MRREGSFFSNLDWLTVFIYLILLILGWFNIYASVYDPVQDLSILDMSIDSGKQLIWIGTSAILIILVLLLDFRIYESVAPLLYGVFILLLIAVVIVGKETNGAKAWFQFGAFRFQPSELAKFATALLLARYVSTNNVKLTNFKNQMVTFTIMLFPVALIMLQPDLGSALIFFSFFIPIFREGLPSIYLTTVLSIVIIGTLTIVTSIETIAIILGSIGLLWILITSKSLKNILLTLLIVGASIGFASGFNYAFNNVLPTYQRDRIMIIFYPNALDEQGAGYNLNQSKIAIGSGGFSGKGFLDGTQTKFDFVPAQSTDFIFSTLAEEHGWLGCALIIALFVALMMRIVFIAERQKSQFARVYGYSIAGIIFFHFTINIAMTIGLFPVVGIPLPFFSYGGSSLWSFTIMLFVLLKIDMHRTQVLMRG